MFILFRLTLLLIVAIAVPLQAHTPPPLPPDPARLAQAERLVEALPFEAALRHGLEGEQIARRVVAETDQWLLTNHPNDQDSPVRQVFAGAVKLQAQNLLEQTFGDVRSAFADHYARFLSVRELAAVQQFASSPEGQAYFALQLRGDESFRQAVVRSIHAKMNLAEILEDARKTSQLIGRVNAGQE